MATITNTMEKAEDNLSNATNDMNETFKDKAAHLGEAIKDTASNVVEKTIIAKDKTVEFIKNNPGKSIGFAFLLGLLYAKRKNVAGQA